MFFRKKVSCLLFYSFCVYLILYIQEGNKILLEGVWFYISFFFLFFNFPDDTASCSEEGEKEASALKVNCMPFKRESLFFSFLPW